MSRTYDVAVIGAGIAGASVAYQLRQLGQTVAVIDMSELLRRMGLDVVGILGFDFLSRFVTKVDYANQLISFYDPDSFKYTGNGHNIDVHIDKTRTVGDVVYLKSDA